MSNCVVLPYAGSTHPSQRPGSTVMGLGLAEDKTWAKASLLSYLPVAPRGSAALLLVTSSLNLALNVFSQERKQKGESTGPFQVILGEAKNDQPLLLTPHCNMRPKRPFHAVRSAKRYRLIGTR